MADFWLMFAHLADFSKFSTVMRVNVFVVNLDIICDTLVRKKLKPLSSFRSVVYEDLLSTYQNISYRTAKLLNKNSFIPDDVGIWNNVGTDFQTCTSLSLFKIHILSLIHPDAKTVFDVHDPTGLKYLFLLN